MYKHAELVNEETSVVCLLVGESSDWSTRLTMFMAFCLTHIRCPVVSSNEPSHVPLCLQVILNNFLLASCLLVIGRMLLDSFDWESLLPPGSGLTAIDVEYLLKEHARSFARCQGVIWAG